MAMLDAQTVETEIRKARGVTIVEDFGGFGWAVDVMVGEVPLPARIVMFWTNVHNETVPEDFMACQGTSTVGEGGYHFRAASFKRISLPSAVGSSLQGIAAASLSYHMDLILGQMEPVLGRRDDMIKAATLAPERAKNGGDTAGDVIRRGRDVAGGAIRRGGEAAGATGQSGSELGGMAITKGKAAASTAGAKRAVLSTDLAKAAAILVP